MQSPIDMDHKAADRAADKVVDKAADKVADKVVDRVADMVVDRVGGIYKFLLCVLWLRFGGLSVCNQFCSAICAKCSGIFNAGSAVGTIHNYNLRYGENSPFSLIKI